MTIDIIAALLGHRSLDMTRRYAQIPNRVVANDYAAVAARVEALYRTDAPLPAETSRAELFTNLLAEIRDPTSPPTLPRQPTPTYRRRCGAVDVFATWDYRVGRASAYVPLSDRLSSDATPSI